MNNPRRVFLSRLALMTSAAALSKPFAAAAAVTKKINTLNAAKSAVTVYHTNNLNGCIEPVHNNLGGLRRIKTVLKDQEANGLLVDGGQFYKRLKQPDAAKTGHLYDERHRIPCRCRW